MTFDNPYLLVPILAVLLSWAHVLVVRLARLRGADYTYLERAHDLPNLALVAVFSLLMTSLAVADYNNPLLGVTTVLAGLTIFQMWNSLPHDEQRGVVRRNYVVSAVVGLVLGVILTVGYWRQSVPELLTQPTKNESQSFLAIFALLFIVSQLVGFAMRRLNGLRKLPTTRTVIRAIRWSVAVPAAIGVIIAFLQNATANDYFTYRIWTFVLWVWVLVGTCLAWLYVYRSAPKLLAEEAAHFEKESKKAKKTRKKKSAKKAKRKK